MKLVIMLPCLNEEKDLLKVLQAIPRQIEKIDSVEILLVDDGSTDGSVNIAEKYGAKVVSNAITQGLAKTFKLGLETALKLGADIIVNIDSDGQYEPREIPQLLEPILAKNADFVIGDRQIKKLTYLSYTVKLIQRLGSAVVSYLAGVEVNDAPSGFRAFNRKAALSLNVLSNYTYTIETILQANSAGLVITSIPVSAFKTERKSRLMSSKLEYVLKSAVTILRVFTMYNPLRTFLTLSFVFFSAGLLLGFRFLYFYFTDGGAGHVQSLVLTGVCLTAGFILFVAGIIADLIQFNRKLLEEINLASRINSLKPE